jgi:hypothetical protein
MEDKKSKSKKESKIKEISKIKNKSKSKKSISKKENNNISKSNTILGRIYREHGELDEIYNMRIEFIKNVIQNKKVPKKVCFLPFLHSISFIHAYKQKYDYTYPKDIEDEYQKLL